MEGDGDCLTVVDVKCADYNLGSKYKTVMHLIMMHYYNNYDYESKLLYLNVIMKYVDTRSLVFFGSAKP